MAGGKVGGIHTDPTEGAMIEIDEHQVVDIRNGIGLALNLLVEILPSWREP